jgi:hypothetical protein
MIMDNKFPSIGGGGGFSIGGLTTYPQAATGTENIPLLATNSTQYKAQLDELLPTQCSISLLANTFTIGGGGNVGFGVGITQNGLWLFTANLTVSSLTTGDVIQQNIQDSTAAYASNPILSSGGNIAGYSSFKMYFICAITTASIMNPIIMDVHVFYKLSTGGNAAYNAGLNTFQATLLNPFYQ